MKTVLSFFIVILAANAAETQTNFEFQCKTKAKEAAVEVYNNCVTEARNQEIDRIRNEYQSKLKELKSHYNGELKKLSPEEEAAGSSAQNSNSTIQKSNLKTNLKSAKVQRPQKQTKGIATTLPSKNEDNGPAIPMAPVHKQNLGETGSVSQAPVKAAPEGSDAEMIEMAPADTN